MAIQIIGNGGVIVEVEANHRAMRSVARPNDVGSLGSYRVGASTGLLAGLAANTPIFSVRWGDATRVMVPRFLRVRYAVVTGFTAAQELAFDAIVARAFSASDSAGTAITLSGNQQKKRTSMGASLVTDMRVAAAVTLTAGTRTLDGQPVLASAKKTLAAAATVQDADFEHTVAFDPGIEWPFVLVTNEGLIVRNTIALGAGGTVRANIEFAWDELASY